MCFAYIEHMKNESNLIQKNEHVKFDIILIVIKHFIEILRMIEF